MKKSIKYSLLVPGIIIAVVIVLLLLAGLLIQTQPVKNRLANFAEKKAGQLLNGELKIGQLNGNFFTHLELEDVLLTQGNDTLAFLRELDLSYDLWPLLQKRLLVHQIYIGQPFFFLKQLNDSTWNVQQIVKPTSNQSDTTSSGTFTIDLQNIELAGGAVKIVSPDTIIPQRIDSLDALAQLYLNGDSQELELKGFSFVSRQPDLVLQQLSFQLKRDPEMISLNDFTLKTAKNSLEGEAQFDEKWKNDASANFQSAPLHLQEFEFLLPDLKIPASPTVNLSADLNRDSLHAELLLENGDASIDLRASSNNLVAFLTTESNVMLDYRVNGKIKNVRLSNWLGQPALNYLINGELDANGKGTDPKTAVVAVNGNFSNLVIQDYPVEILDFNFDYNAGDLTGFAKGNGNFGSFELTPNIRDLLTNPSYRLELLAQNLNLALLLGNDSLQSDINLTASINGAGFDLKKLNADAEIYASPSEFQALEIDTMLARLHYANKNVRVDSLRLETKQAQVTAHGNYSLDSSSEMWLTARVDGLEEFEYYLPVDSLQTSGNLNAHLTGTPDSLRADADVELNNTVYGGMELGQLNLNAIAQVNGRDTLLDADLNAQNFSMGTFALDSIIANMEASTDSAFVSAKVSAKDLHTDFTAGATWDEVLRVTLEKLSVAFKNQSFDLQQLAVVEIDSMDYRVQNFKLASGDTDSAQFISANGLISRNGNEDFKFEIANVDVSKIPEMFNQQINVEGLLNVNLYVTGNAASPLVIGDYKLVGAQFNEYAFSQFSGTLDFEDKQLSAFADIVPVDSGNLSLTAKAPMVMELDSFNFSFSTQDSIDVVLNVDRFPLAVLEMIDFTEDVSGYLQGEINVGGTVEAPNPEGKLKLVDASARIPKYGIDYRKIELGLDFMRDVVKLDTFYIKTSDGNLTGTGQVDFNSDFYKGDVSSSKISLKFDEFNPVDHDQFNMQVSGEASLSGDKGAVVFDGDLTIPQAELFLPAIMRLMGNFSSPEIAKPILVKQKEWQQKIQDTVNFDVGQQKTDTTGFTFNYLDKLSGTLKIEIPKNFWVKNDNMRIELKGDVEVRKNQDFMELFGTVDVVRGQYDLLGKTFVIDEGTITFEGGEEIKPRMDITASYRFRDVQRVEKTLSVTITGTPEQPEVEFTMDGNAVNEGDALSYLFFGKSMDQLSMSQQDGLSGSTSAGQIAETAAASLLSSQLSNFLGDKLAVDYIEVKSQGGFENASVVVGKYVTNDLFVSYEQQFGDTQNSDVGKYEVIAEYELFKFLFIQLNNSDNESGFNFIFKYDSK